MIIPSKKNPDSSVLGNPFRFVFLLENAFVNLGICSLTAILKQKGIETHLIIAAEETDPMQKLIDLNPQVIGFSLLTGNHVWAGSVVAEIRKHIPDVRIVYGGLHPTLFPEIIERTDIDAICRGEGEEALPEYVIALKNNLDTRYIKNFWVKTPDGIIKNDLRPIIENLDDYPDPDRDCYRQYSYAVAEWDKYFNLGRGCAYLCSFCANHQLMKLYGCGGKFVRRRSAERVINEILRVLSCHPLNEIIYVDETFNLETKWLKHFLDLYKSQIKVPFISSIGIETTDAEQIRLLKEAGCKIVIFGVESGNQNVRNKVLKKPFKNDKMLYLASLMHRQKLPFLTTNIVGVPGETIDQAWETVDFNIRLKPRVAVASFLMPYPKTDIHDLAVSMGLIEPIDPDDVRPNLYVSPILNTSDNKKIKNLQRFFTLLVRFPWLYPFVKKLLWIPPNPVFELFFLIGFAYYQYAFYQRGILGIWAYGIRNIRLFLKQNRKLKSKL